MTEIRERDGICSFLGTGEGAALTMRELSRMTGRPSREIRMEIMRQRRNGVPILSSPRSDGGYFIGESAGEIRRCVASLRGRAKEILETARAIESVLPGGDQIAGQIEMEVTDGDE